MTCRITYGTWHTCPTGERFPREALNKSENYLVRHSGASQNPVKTIVYWMLAFASMTERILIQSFLNMSFGCKTSLYCTLRAASLPKSVPDRFSRQPFRREREVIHGRIVYGAKDANGETEGFPRGEHQGWCELTASQGWQVRNISPGIVRSLMIRQKLARPRGFEPLTSGFGGLHSIQLS